MAKKAPKEATDTISLGITPTTNPTVQSTEEELVKLPCAREYFFTYGRRAWGYCLDHLPLFFGESDRFTVEFIEDQIALIDAGELLPNNDVRVGEASAEREVLLAYAQQVRTMAKRLGIIINYAYKDPAVAHTQRTTAGLTAFSGISIFDWGGYESFINKANIYLAANATSLVAAHAMKAGFPAAFETLGNTFKLSRKSFNDKENLAKMGTKALNDALKEILKELNPMLDLGKEIFEFNATLRKLFTSTDLVREVQGTYPAGVTGFVRLLGAAQPTPLEGIRVQVVGLPDKFAITDKRGKYIILLAQGKYDIEFTSPDYAPLTITNKKLSAGVRSRLSVELSPMPVTVEIVPEPSATLAPDVTDNQFSHAISDMIDTSRLVATNGEVG